MSISNILTIALSSSVVASSVTFIFNRYLHRDTYKKEYYKRLIDKRMDAYSAVEKLSNSIKPKVMTDRGIIPLIMAGGHDEFAIFLISIIPVQHKSMWLSDEIGKLISELNVFLINEIDNKIDENQDVQVQLNELGRIHLNRFRKFVNDIETQMFKDLTSLHNIPEFIQKSKGIEIRLPLYSKSPHLEKQTQNDITKHQE
jgi:hypothetical protein